jgi:predicted nucleic acid-binding protein
LSASAVDVAVYFLDSSTVVKRYVREAGTAWIQALTAPGAGHSFFVVRLTFAEVIAAVTRRERAGHLAAPSAATVVADFQHDFTRQYLVVEVSAGLVDRAASLARTHGLRGYDAVQLAAALEVHAQAPTLTLLSSDAELNAAAVAEGLSVDDPNQHP